jgi:hypothetical protein
MRRQAKSLPAAAFALATALALLPTVTPVDANAALTTFGSPLSGPATKDTANDLSYKGTDVTVPGATYHIPHDGADTALWNTQLAAGSPTAPADGQVVSVRLEGCAKPNGTPPLTQIHFQSLSPLAGGGAKVELTSQAFDIPVCGSGGAGGSTISTYRPINLCVSQGDYVAFNDEGGFVPASSGLPPYPAGVPYMVIGGTAGSSMSSFIADNGVGNGATFSPSNTSNHDGFAVNPAEELMLQTKLGTGPDAVPACGGSKGVVAVHHHTWPALSIPTPQHDGMNQHGVVQVAIFCHAASGCPGSVTLRSRSPHGSRKVRLGAATFTLAAHHTGHVRIRLSAHARRLIHSAMGGIRVLVTLDTPHSKKHAGHASIAVYGRR